jgi:hypothetical protein
MVDDIILSVGERVNDWEELAADCADYADGLVLVPIREIRVIRG